MEKRGEKDNSYRSIFKGISLFGGVKVFETLINLVRGKFVALFLGPGGMGISSIFTNISTTISQMASLGLNLAVVKEVAAAKDDEDQLSHVISGAVRLFFFTSLLGATACCLLSYLLSMVSFGSTSFTYDFILLAVAIFFLIDNGGKLAILQGLHEVKRLSKASLTGSLAGLFFGIPLYYFFGTKGIVPAIIMLALTLNIFYSLNLRAVRKNLPEKKFSFTSHRQLIRKLFSLGMVLLASSLIGTLCNYLILIIVRKIGSLDDVGFFQAANSITNQMAGVVLTAIALDYFPRLSASATDNEEMADLVDRQSVMVLWIVVPVASLMILGARLIVEILLTSQFEAIIPLLRWMALGVVIKAVAYPVSYITFAKDNKKLFFWLEGVVGNILFLLIPVLMFRSFGLAGFGYGMVAEQSLCLLIYWGVNRRVYGYRPDSKVLVTLAGALVTTITMLLLSYISSGILSYSLMTGLAIAVCATSLLKLRKLIKT